MLKKKKAEAITILKLHFYSLEIERKEACKKEFLRTLRKIIINEAEWFFEGSNFFFCV